MHNHECTCDHHAKGKLKASLYVIGLVFFVELVGGIISNSLSLIGDAMHMFLDSFALFMAFFAICMAGRSPTLKRTFGYHRTEVFAAVLNSVFLLVVIIGISYKAILRIFDPAEVKTMQMLVVAVLGMLANLYALFKLHGYHDMNMKAAYLHVIGDTVTSFAVIAGAIAMKITGLMAIDPIISLVIAAVLLVGAVRLLKDASDILIQGVPKGIDVDDVISEMRKVKKVEDVHSVHLWCLCSHINILSAHVLVREDSVKETEGIAGQLEKRLEKFSIKHATFQFECEKCRLPQKLRHLKH